MRHPTQTNRYFLPYMTSCRDDTGVMSDRTSDVIQKLSNDSEQKDSIKNAFEDFWEAVPKKVGKKAAWEAFKVARKTVDAYTLKQGMVRYAKKVKADGTPLAHSASDDVAAGRQMGR